MPYSKHCGIICLIFSYISFCSNGYIALVRRLRDVVARVDLFMTEEGRFNFFVESRLISCVLYIFSADGVFFILLD